VRKIIIEILHQVIHDYDDLVFYLEQQEVEEIEVEVQVDNESQVEVEV